MTLTEFLLARRAEETENRLISDAAWDAVQMRLTAPQANEWLRNHDRSFQAQAARAHAAAGDVGWALLAAVWPAAARREAARFADHPDYKQEWCP